MASSRSVQLSATAGALALALTGLATTSSSAADETQLTIVHGLPGEQLDVAVDGETLVEGLEVTEVSDRLDIEPGEHTVELTDADGETVGSNTVDVAAGGATDVVVHLAEEEGDPVVTAYDYDLGAVPAGKASVTIAQVAAMVPADIRVDGKVLFANVANGESVDITVPAGTYTVDVVPTGEKKPVLLGPMDVTKDPGSTNRLYIIGDPDDDSVGVAAHIQQAPETGSAAPDSVPAGDGGQAAAIADVLTSVTG